MAPGPLPELRYSAAERATLVGLARDSIAAGLRGDTLAVHIETHAPALRERRASFITLNRHGRLRGCIGTLEARRALVTEVAAMAHAAAFHDPRFAPLASHEFEELELHISVLSPPEPMTIDSEQGLLERLRPGIDGLILREAHRQATFLPAVWEQLPDPAEFLRRLKLKAGMAADHWSARIEISRYTAESIP